MPLLLVYLAVQLWQQAPPMPTPGYGFACAAAGERVYAIGGARGGQDSVMPRYAVEVYDAAADTWLTDYPQLPVPRWYVAGAELDGMIYVIGGTNSRVEFQRVDRFDPATNTWDTVAQLPWPRSGMAACTYNGAIYAVGGYCACGRESYQRSVARFLPDGGIGRWEILDSLATPRSGHGAAEVNGRIYAVGGKFFSNLSSMECYWGDTWHSDMRMMRDARSGLALVGYGDLLCAIGGFGQRYPLASVEFLNPASGSWYRGEPLHEARAYCSAARIGNRVFVMGGRGMMGVLGSVETDSLQWTAIAEPETATPVASSLPGPTIASVRSLPGLAGRAELYDARGAAVSLSGLKPGLYFLRFPDGTTRRLALVR